jgi:hypothetical protein
MAEESTVEEKLQRFDAALDKLQLTVELGAGVPHEILNQFLAAAEIYRSDMRYKALLGSAGSNSDRIP